MQAIRVRYLSPTDRRGARLKASCERGSVTIPYPHGLSRDDIPRAALNALVAKFVAEDGPGPNPWARPWVGGGTDNGETVFVCGDGWRHLVVECANDTDAGKIREACGNPRQPDALRLGILREAIGRARA